MGKRDPNRHFEKPDPNPMALPSGFKRPETLAEQVRRLVRSHQFALAAEQEGYESFEEADDFDIPDDPPDPATPFEPFFDPGLGREVTPADVIHRRDQYAAETSSRVQKAAERKQRQAATPPAAPPAAGSQGPEKPPLEPSGGPASPPK